MECRGRTRERYRPTTTHGRRCCRSTCRRRRAEPHEAWLARSLAVASLRAPLQHDFMLKNHVADDTFANFGECLHPVAKAIVRHDAGVDLAREQEDEIVGIGAGRRLPHYPVVDHLLITLRVVDLMS